MLKLVGIVVACVLGVGFFYLSRFLVREFGWLVWSIMVVSAVWYISVFNVFITHRNAIQESWSQIDVQMRRRYDLVANLVEAVKGYAGHEREVLQSVTKFRSATATGDRSAAEEVEAQNVLTGVLKTLFAVAEAYPQLKADQGFLNLQAELSFIEQSIASQREDYNRQVREYNIACQSFFTHLVAAIQGFAPQNYLQIADAANDPVAVSF